MRDTIAAILAITFIWVAGFTKIPAAIEARIVGQCVTPEQPQ